MSKKVVILLVILFFLSSALPAFAYDPRYRFTDQENDAESGLYNFDAREYNPNTGRFLQQDPILKDGELNSFFLKPENKEKLEKILMDPQSLNSYGYVKNNPIKYVDPNGEQAVPIDVVLDPMFVTESYDNMNTKRTSWSQIAFGADLALLIIPFMPSAVHKIVNWIEGIKISNIFKNAEKFKNIGNLANFSCKEQLMANYYQHKGSIGEISMKEFSNKAQNLFKRFINGDGNIVSGFKKGDRVIFDKVTKEFSIVTKNNIIKTFYIPQVKDPYQYFLRNIEQ